MTCVSCGGYRPECATRCNCGATQLVHAEPFIESLTLDGAWVYGPTATDREVEFARNAYSIRKGIHTADNDPAPYANAFNLRNAPSTPCPASDMVIPPPGSRWMHNSTGITYKAGQVSFAINSKEFTEVKCYEPKPKAAKVKPITPRQQAQAAEDASLMVGQLYLHRPTFRAFAICKIEGDKVTLRYRRDGSITEWTKSEFNSGGFSKLY